MYGDFEDSSIGILLKLAIELPFFLLCCLCSRDYRRKTMQAFKYIK